MGAIPSGSDPGTWDATTPGADPGSGFDATALDNSVAGGAVVGAGLSSLIDRTQVNVQSGILAQIQANPVLAFFSNLIFEGLNIIKLPLAIIEAIVTRLFGLLPGFGSTEEALATIQQIPILGDLLELILGVEDGDPNDLGTFFLNLRNIFTVNLLDPALDLAEAATAFIANFLSPANILATINQVFDVIEAIAGFAGATIEDVAELFTSLGEDLLQLFAAFTGIDLTGAPGAILGAVQSVVNTVIQAILGIPGTVEDVAELFIALGGDLLDLFSAFTGIDISPGAILEAITNAVNGVITTIISAFGGVGETLEDLGEVIAGIAGTITDILSDLGTFALQSALSALSSTVTTVSGVASGAAALIQSVIDALVGAGGSVVGSIINQANYLLRTIFGLNVQSGVNLVVDPGFEDSTIWANETTAGGSGISTAQAFPNSGTKSYKLVGLDGTLARRVWLNNDGSSGSGLTAHRWKIKGGTTFTVKGKVYKDSGNDNTGSLVVTFARFPGTGTLAPGSVPGDSTTVSIAQSTLTPGAWNDFTATHTFPTLNASNAAYTEAAVAVGWSSTTGVTGQVFYIDQVEVRDTTEPQSILDTINQVVTGVFTAGAGTLTGIFEWATNIPALIGSQAATTFNNAKTFVTDLAATIFQAISAALGTIPFVGGYISDAFNDVGDAIAALVGITKAAADVKSITGTYAQIMQVRPKVGQVAFATDRGLNLIGVAIGDSVEWSNGAVTTGPLAQLYGPIPSGGTDLNGASNITYTLGELDSASQPSELLLTVNSAAGDNLRGRYWSLPGTVPVGYERVFYIEYGVTGANYAHTVAFLRSSAGKLITVGICYSNGVKLQVNKWNSATSFNSTVYSTDWPFITGSGYLKVGDDGTNVYFAASINGRDWNVLFSEARGTFLGSGGTVDTYGIAGFSSNGGTTLVRARSHFATDDTRVPGMVGLNLTLFRPIVTNKTSSLILTDSATSSSKVIANSALNVKYGDLLIVYAYNANSTTTPSLPSGWTSVATGSGNGQGYRHGYKIATTDGVQSTGTWTNATGLIILVYRGAALGGASANVGTKSSSGPQVYLSISAMTLDDSSGLSDDIIILAHNQNSVEQFDDGTLGTDGFVKLLSVADPVAKSVMALYRKTGVTSSGSTDVRLGGPVADYRFRRMEVKVV